MPKLTDAFPTLTNLYDDLPDVPCEGCGGCCVSPHMSLVEFAYLLDYLLKTFSPDEVAALVRAPMASPPGYEGDYSCRFQDRQGRCRVYLARSLSCRVEGLPVMDILSDREVPLCRHAEKKRMSIIITEVAVTQWIIRLLELCKPYQGQVEEPYFFNSLNVECWFAVALDPKIKQPFFLGLKNLISDEFDLGFLESVYVDHTGLADLISDIDEFFETNRKNQPQAALAAIRRVVENYPETGAYYKLEGQEFLKHWEKLLAGQGGG